MQRVWKSRWPFLALLIFLIPASSYAGVFISVGFAPPALPVYVQPPCPQPGLMWTPGYWAYGADGYYWVPGAWVPAPYVGALWTPGYWGWGSGLYVWHPGYWGPHVGYYGGVNYGFGYMGIGFVGGVWRGRVFAYNSAVMHVGVGGGWGNRVYVDRTIVERNTIVNDRRVAFSGGPGGIRHDPTPAERMADRDQHMERTSFQTQHANEAMNNRSSYFKNNGGHPQTLATARPLQAESHPAPNSVHQQGSFNGRGNSYGSQPRQQSQSRATPRNQPRNNEFQRGNQQSQPRNESRPQPQHQSRPAPQSHPQHESKGPKGRGR
ncbi:MAG TPA: YXWGXW repeat-containing protein [Terracidiphilus sp.]|nr:YXWGXW repeat-containing protein [Terracidiphilus sp.]